MRVNASLNKQGNKKAKKDSKKNWENSIGFNPATDANFSPKGIAAKISPIAKNPMKNSPASEVPRQGKSNEN